MLTPRMGCAVVVLLLSCGPIAVAADDKDRKAAEMKWAKGVVTDFVDLTNRGQWPQGGALLTASLRTCLDPKNEGFGPAHFGLFGNLKEVTFTSEEMSPDQDEVLLRGTAKDANIKNALVKVQFRVVKEQGKWRIGQFDSK